jgi:hypothetical protein
MSVSLLDLIISAVHSVQRGSPLELGVAAMTSTSSYLQLSLPRPKRRSPSNASSLDIPSPRSRTFSPGSKASSLSPPRSGGARSLDSARSTSPSPLLHDTAISRPDVEYLYGRRVLPQVVYHADVPVDHSGAVAWKEEVVEQHLVHKRMIERSRLQREEYQRLRDEEKRLEREFKRAERMNEDNAKLRKAREADDELRDIWARLGSLDEAGDEEKRRRQELRLMRQAELEDAERIKADRERRRRDRIKAQEEEKAARKRRHELAEQQRRMNAQQQACVT